MTISIIIPTYNEERCIAQTLAHLRALAGAFEILVVDGGSSDATVEIARRLQVRVAEAPRGRAVQMNHGASLARGEILLFLHADTRLPPNACALITAACSTPELAGGCFRLSFDADRRALRFFAFFTRFSLPFMHYGDSGYFVRAAVFRILGGYRPYPIMEDVDFWRRLRRHGRVAVLGAPVVTSARRFLRYGVLRQQLVAFTLLLLYLVGVSPHTLKRYYEEIR